MLIVGVCLNIAEIVEPVKYSRLLSRSRTPVLDLTLISSIRQGKKYMKEKKGSGDPSVKIILIKKVSEELKKQADQDSLGKRLKDLLLRKRDPNSKWAGKAVDLLHYERPWDRRKRVIREQLGRNFVGGWKDAAKQAGKFGRGPVKETLGGFREAGGNKLGKLMIAPFIYYDAKMLSGVDSKTKKKNYEALNKSYGKDVADYYSRLKKKNFQNLSGRLPERLGRVIGDVASFGLMNNVRGIIPAATIGMSAGSIGGKIGALASRAVGVKKPEMTEVERSALSVLGKEADRISRENKLRASVIKKMSADLSPMESLLASAIIGVPVGYIIDRQLYGGLDEDTAKNRLLKKIYTPLLASPVTANVLARASEPHGTLGMLAGTGVGIAASKVTSKDKPKDPTSGRDALIKLLKLHKVKKEER